MGRVWWVWEPTDCAMWVVQHMVEMLNQNYPKRLIPALAEVRSYEDVGSHQSFHPLMQNVQGRMLYHWQCHESNDINHMKTERVLLSRENNYPRKCVRELWRRCFIKDHSSLLP
jgi:hypothetical protein